MKDLTEYQLRHLAVITNRLAAMDGRALFAAMQRIIGRKKFAGIVHPNCWPHGEQIRRYARCMVKIRAELARRGIK